ncbi:hypothetical protein GCM10011369_28250 [Neiella marina]|uniref:Uncharacterized protein n=1 Tax=Neiella marina TaxID=508461 RepID=A0A8J2U7J4_9GAMM|nr:hypothetical protein [Neiella marina]GGA84544.1 hypothetical protein GCM10011369_28250 [Neiella marina]
MTTEQRNDTDIKELESDDNRSRFERRRFLRGSAAAAPLLMTVKSPVAWAGGNTCTASVYISGNASHQHDCDLIGALSHGTWKAVLTAPNNHTRRFLRQLIDDQTDVGPSTDFMSIFFSKFFTSSGDPKPKYIKKAGVRTWQYQLLQPLSAVPFNAAIDQSSTLPDVKFDFWEIANPSNRCTVNLFGNAASNSFYYQVLTAYLNGLFSNTIIDYPYTHTEVVGIVENAVKSMIKEIKVDIKQTAGSNTSTAIAGCGFITNHWQDLTENSLSDGGLIDW